jgi:hypothetical protein
VKKDLSGYADSYAGQVPVSLGCIWWRCPYMT